MKHSLLLPSVSRPTASMASIVIACMGMSFSGLGQQLTQTGTLPIASSMPTRQEVLAKAQQEHTLSKAALPAGGTLKPISTNDITSTCGNLVINGNFEKQKVSPLSGAISNIHLPSPNGPDELANWQSTTNIQSPDYFATNTPNQNNAANPNAAFAGPFQPFTTNQAHNGCVGMFTYVADNPPPNPVGAGTINSPNWYAEYVEGSLTQPLQNGHTYYASLRAYLASYSPVTTRIGLDISAPRSSPTNTIQLHTAGSSSVQSSGVISSGQWNRVSGIFTCTPATAGAQAICVGNFDHTTRSLVTPPPPSPPRQVATEIYSYMYVDSVEVYEIPTAGPNVSICSGDPVTLGEGCDIPGAQYVWQARQGVTAGPVLATTRQLTISPTQSTDYRLVVTLPDGSFFSSVVRVTLSSSTLPIPIISRYGGLPNDCYRQDHFQIDNYSTAYTYTVNNISNATPSPLHPTSRFFTVSGVDQSNLTEYGSFTVTATLIGGGCGVTTEEIQAEYPCSIEASRSSQQITAYPSPANERLTLPKGTSSATLLNSQGRAVAQSDATGTLNVQHLPAGLYNLRMEQNGKLINQHIEVKH